MGSKVGKFRGLLAVTSSNESSPNPFVSISKTSDRDSSALLDTQCNWKILPCSRCQLDIPYLGHQRRRNGRMFWWKPTKMWPKQIPRSDKLQRHGYGYGSKPWCADGTLSHSWWIDAYSPRFWPISKMPRSKIRLGLVHTFPDDSYGNGWNWQRWPVVEMVHFGVCFCLGWKSWKIMQVYESHIQKMLGPRKNNGTSLYEWNHK